MLTFLHHISGPCSVITAVQAYMLKNLLCECSSVHQFKDLTEDKCRKILIKAICNILEKCKDGPTIRVVQLSKANLVDKAQEASETEESGATTATADEQMESSLGYVDDTSISDVNNPDIEITLHEFHERLVIVDFQAIEDVEKFYSENYDILSSRFGILLYLYSVLFTKSAEHLINEIGDISEPLICHTFGYGSQSLINLLLTGKAVQHVFDNVQDIGGMKLQGVEKQSDIGFVTLMETLRYIAVGSYYKNPKYPIWVVGSETHLTVLFSNEKSLVSPETPSEHARRVFSKYDTENSSELRVGLFVVISILILLHSISGFISSAVLQDVLNDLGLESDAGYVEIMQRKLDPDGTSIILLNDFMYEFFPDDKKSTPDTFDLYHYNGIPNSNEGHLVRYSCGKAILLESHIYDMSNQSNSLLTCLQTKWPNIEINWNQQRVPSIN